MGKAPQKKGKHNHGSKKPKESVYLSKAQCLHRLQVTQTDFRRLCVLKGIYPQLPENVKGLQSGKMYFFSKDIKFLMHEPVLEKFRELKSFIKRLKSAREKDEKQHENALMKYVKPNLTYDHLIKERYPTFFSALEDLDDCLTLLFMLSKLPPQDDLQRIEIENASRLCKEFTTYVTKEKCLTKVFLTVKGIYYQAMILGVKITWLVPYDFPQIVPMQVDFKVFKTFLSLYDTLLTFVNFKLFHMMGQKYPPKHQEKHETTIESYILNLPEPEREKEELTEKQKEIQKESEKRIESLNSKITKIVKNQKETNEKEEENEPIVEESDEEDEKVKETTIEPFKQTDKKDIFKSLTFFISRECPKASLEFVIKSQGGHVSFDEKDEKITHHVLDRPTIKNKLLREYIQPQWVYDCVNNQILLPVHKYEPGSTLPPHLSPFVDYEDENQYVPEYQEELSILKKETAALKEVEEGIEEETDEEEMEEIYQRELEAEKKGKKAEEFQEELKEEKIEKIKEKVRNPKKMSKKQEKEDEEKKLKLTMMSNRARNLYTGKMKSDKKKQDIADNLKRKREMIKEKKKQENNDEQPIKKKKQKK